MAKFLMLGKYSQGAVKGIASERTQKAVDLIKKQGGSVDAMLALLGGYDLALTVNLPGITDAMKISIELAKLTGISFTSFPAITVEELDKIG